MYPRRQPILDAQLDATLSPYTDVVAFHQNHFTTIFGIGDRFTERRNRCPKSWGSFQVFLKGYKRRYEFPQGTSLAGSKHIRSGSGSRKAKDKGGGELPESRLLEERSRPLTAEEPDRRRVF